ncbi:MAG: transcription antitermination factor NusB [Saprospiraceae bacterium]|nr:transcription antitermination factor NusB [Saprospiraceae bacterium]
MLSRRNVRVKVMQVLYAQSRDEKLGPDEVMKAYRTSVRNSFELYLFTLVYLLRIAEYAATDYTRRKAKHLPTDEDRAFSPRLAENEVVQSLSNHAELQRTLRAYKLDKVTEDDKVRQLYQELAKTDEYKAYLELPDPTKEDHINILVHLFKVCLGNEAYNDFVEDAYPLWTDDESLIVGAIKKTLRALPAAPDFLEEYRPSREATVEFGEQLLRLACREDKEYFDLIEPTLKNWDADRVAIIDMILLKMALCELTHFPTIPTKVTLNEFVEVSKTYSTEKSKEFINGILDRLMKILIKEGKIVKEGRGLME